MELILSVKALAGTPMTVILLGVGGMCSSATMHSTRQISINHVTYSIVTNNNNMLSVEIFFKATSLITWAEFHKKLVRPGPHQIFKIFNVTAIFPGHVLCKIFKMPHQNLKGLTRI